MTLELEPLTFDVNGTKTVVLAAGDPAAPPLVFLHGGGTFHGWRFPEPWTSAPRADPVPSRATASRATSTSLREIHDLVLHYTELFDQLGLTDDVNLVGFSLGGLVAARFAIEQKHRLRRLVLVAPTGLRAPGVEVDDLFRIPPEELVGRARPPHGDAEPYLPDDPHDVDFTVDRYREMRTTALMLWDHPFDRVVPRWLGRVDIPSLVVWGEEDRLLPAHGAGVGRPAAERLRGDVPERRPPRPRRVADASPPSPGSAPRLTRAWRGTAPRRRLRHHRSWPSRPKSTRATSDAAPRRRSLASTTPTSRRRGHRDWDEVGHWPDSATSSGCSGPRRRRCRGDVRPDAVALMDDARAAGRARRRPDQPRLHDPRPRVLRRPARVRRARTFIDAAEIGCPSPTRRAYLIAAERARRAHRARRVPRRHAGCVDGARVGMIGILVDPVDRRPAFDEARDCSAWVTERVVITGANRGLGLELARVYAARRRGVGRLSPPWRRASCVADRPRPCSTSASRLDRAVRAPSVRPVDVLINNAGVDGGPSASRRRARRSAAQRRAVLDEIRINALGPMLLSRASSPLRSRTPADRQHVLDGRLDGGRPRSGARRLRHVEGGAEHDHRQARQAPRRRIIAVAVHPGCCARRSPRRGELEAARRRRTGRLIDA